MATSKVLCRYYMSNCCSRGDACPFSHNSKDTPDSICRYYLKGACVYGSSCRYVHQRPKSFQPSFTKRPVSEPPLPKIPGPVSLAAAAGLDIQPESGLVTLVKDPTRKPSEWVKAPEFIPGSVYHGGPTASSKNTDHNLLTDERGYEEDEDEYFFSYSQVAMLGLPDNVHVLDEISLEDASDLLCPFYENAGVCPRNESCEYTHGLECDMCFKNCLHPNKPEQQKEHKRQCVKTHEEEMKKAFAHQRSEGRVCGICMEVVLTKPARSDRRFGILSNCDHCFCLACIRKWRSTAHSTRRIIRACPLCRAISYIVIPSEVWLSEKLEKDELLESYKGNLSAKPCKYFDEGRGTCPFSDSCLYRHAFPDGTLSKATPRLTYNSDGLTKPVGTTTLWEFLEEREERVWTAPEPSEDYWDDDGDHDEGSLCGGGAMN